MLIEFSVGNFRSFKSPVTLSMVAAKINAKDKQIDVNNTIPVDEDLTLLSSAVIYGANASGKSNLISAINFMRRFVMNSSRESQTSEKIHTDLFRLCKGCETKPSFFQIVFILEGKKYRYGFEVNKEKVVSEWLFITLTRKETKIFVRDEEGIHISRNFKEGKGLELKTRSNALFLSVVAQFNGQISMQVLSWFGEIGIIFGLNDRGYKGFTLKCFEDDHLRNQIINLVKRLDLGILDINSEKMKDDEAKIFLPPDLPDDVRENVLKEFEADRVKIKTLHNKFDEEGKLISAETFNLATNESEGTQKLFFLTGPLLVTMAKGRVLFIDELEARLHPLITASIIALFNSKETNPHNAQIIFTTHDTNLLSNKIFRRDQIWFTEKDHQGATHLYSLVEIKVRNDASFENDYIEGKYGAIPFIGDLQRINVELEQ